MLLLGFFLGLAVGIGFWVWQQAQLNRYLERSTSTANLPLFQDEVAA